MLNPISIAEDIHGATDAYDPEEVFYCDYCGHGSDENIILDKDNCICPECANNIETAEELASILGYYDVADLVSDWNNRR